MFLCDFVQVQFIKMGRVKFSKKNRSELNRKSISKRWDSYNQLGNSNTGKPLDCTYSQSNVGNPGQIDYENVRPGPSNEDIPLDNSRPVQLPPEPTEDDFEENTPIRKRPKEFELVSSYNPTVDACSEDSPAYCLVDLAVLTNFVKGLPCKFCFDINSEFLPTKQKGFAQEISFHCLSCDQITSFETSRKIHDDTVKTRPPYDINRRMVKTFSSLGKGHTGLQTFCMGLNMPCINHSAYDKQMNIIVDIAKEHVDSVLKNARVEVQKAYCELEPTLEIKKPLDITVSYDGSWQKRGFTSKYGIGCVIELITGLVIDFEVISKYCRVCEKKKSELGEDSEEYEEWLLDHWLTCQANFDGSSPAMEAEGAERLWKRSQDIGFRYTSFVSDCDSKTHDHLASLEVYGKGVKIEKQECVNHIPKRMVHWFAKVDTSL